LKKLIRRKKKYLSEDEAEQFRAAAEELYRDRFSLELHPLQTDKRMVPPAEIVNQVQGRSKSDVNTFLGTGYRDAVRYLTQIIDNGGDPASMEKMLDFGFGTGRILLQFLPFAMERYGCDVNPVSVEWTSKTLGEFADLRQTELDPPLPFDSDMFDLVIANSVFTHIPYDAQPGWIAEFGRLVKPGGFVLATIHDFDKLPASAREAGWAEKGTDRGLHNNTYLSREKLVEIWQPYFEVLDVYRNPPGQSHVVIRRK
jgi:SAM-dependent methyltransferase